MSNKKNTRGTTRKNKNKGLLWAASALALVLAVVAVGALGGLFSKPDSGSNGKVGNDLIIPINEVTEQAAFYPLEIGGTKLEVLAVRAPDGSVRTAFNTCQVCYSSGRGYYVQQGDVLVCQNCGNRFKASDVEVTRGGCNPVPITADDKTVDGENIIIPREFLAESVKIFKNWKR